uniref:NAC domain-containing protein 72-like n=1 Tax=Elaeis guineensis var. tenera TaxID=51953 RepID=A0A6J0PNI7_ELAGV|nr:NAC domain-containing protein 72-like [Elaeis guineensis]
MDPGCWRFDPDTHLLLEYLLDPARVRMLFSGAIHEGIDPYSCRPEQLPNISEKGSYYYYANRPGRNQQGQNRQTADGTGYWRAKDKQEVPDKDGRTVACMRNLRFYLGTHKNSNSTKWVMTELTLVPDTGHDAAKAISMIRRTAGNRRNEINQASSNSDATNRPLPESEPCMDSSSRTNLGAWLMSVAARLGVPYELPPEFSRD